jgi:ubiquinone/menaquinone biosynthesis C-methylase UbiE
MIDWGEGTYEHTAETLVEAAEVGVDALELAPGDRVLDLGCGTGNAALAAARRGAKVVAIDPAARLVEVTTGRANSEGLEIETCVGDASAIPGPDASFDALVSIFAVIFAPDAERAASEMVRVVRPGGRIAITTWLPRGPIFQAGMILRAAMAALAPPGTPSAPPPPWGDEAAVRALFESRGARVELTTRSIAFEAASAEAWFAEQEASHPVWRFVHRALEASPEKWRDLRSRSIDAIEAGNSAKGSLRVESEYLLVKAIVS